MKAESYTTQSTSLFVSGRAWSGAKCEHEYAIHGEPPKTIAEAKRIAGDFESLERAEVVTITRKVKETVNTAKLQ